jgi:hypothetical protein
VREVSAAVEQLRGLKFKTPVQVEIIDGATARANFKARIDPSDEEQAHALEDQNYDLEAVSRQAKGDDDRATAIRAVVEGSATAVMIAYLSRNGGAKEAREELEKGEVLLAARWTNKAASGVVADLYHHYVNGGQRVTLLVTRWETSDDAREFDEALLNRGQQRFRFGANVVVLAGDVGDEGEPLAVAALQGMQFWPTR